MNTALFQQEMKNIEEYALDIMRYSRRELQAGFYCIIQENGNDRRQDRWQI